MYDNDKPLIMVTGLWKTTSSKDGREFLSGSFTFGTQVFIFENKFKSKPSDPDYQMYIGAKRKPKQMDEPPPIEDEDHYEPASYDDIPF